MRSVSLCLNDVFESVIFPGCVSLCVCGKKFCLFPFGSYKTENTNPFVALEEDNAPGQKDWGNSKVYQVLDFF